MDQLREGIGLRAYCQKNPLIEYKKEGFGMFNEMISNIDQEILKKVFRTNIDSISASENKSVKESENLICIEDESSTTITNLEIYPNPSRGIFNISFTTQVKQELEIRIVNTLGNQVFIESKYQFIGEYTKQIDLTEYPKAIYFLEIETDEGVINKNLILQ